MQQKVRLFQTGKAGNNRKEKKKMKEENVRKKSDSCQTVHAQHHRSTLLQKRFDRRQTNAPAAAGDDCNFMFQ